LFAGVLAFRELLYPLNNLIAYDIFRALRG
jgi:hypothetical protein